MVRPPRSPTRLIPVRGHSGTLAQPSDLDAGVGLGHHSSVLSRRFFASCCAVIVGAAAANPGAVAGAEASIVLGKKHLLSYGIGWGTAHPRVIYNGGDPTGKAWHLTWRNWGAAVAYARGLTWIEPHRRGYHGKGAIELRASRIGRCTPQGPRAYTYLQARVVVRPGGRLSQWFAWSGWKSICKFPP
jgi:hypothetical protein